MNYHFEEISLFSEFKMHFWKMYRQISYDYKKALDCTEKSVKFGEIEYCHYINLSPQ